MTRIILLSSLALSIAGCQPMDAVEGKPSAAQRHQERMALVTMPLTFALDMEPEPSAIQHTVAQEPDQPVCSETFRINRCVGGVSVDWFYGEVAP